VIRPFLLLVLLLVLPVMALHRGLGATATGFAAGWAAAVSALTFVLYASDKRQARGNDRRTPELWLHVLELAGGWPGAFLAQRRLRHKSSKLAYQLAFWLIVALYEIAAIGCLRGWRITH
jgi:uncharacterized membrane protein YsdA (DUF1294 family)